MAHRVEPPPPDVPPNRVARFRPGALARPGRPAFAVLFALDSLSRAILVTVVAFDALALLGDAQTVSVLYFAVSAVGLAGSFGVPWLIRRMRRAATLALSCALLVAAAALLASHTLVGLAIGITAAFLGAAGTGICLNLCVLEHIPRHDFIRFEPLRTLFIAGVWTIGPVGGVILDNHVAEWTPYALSAGSSFAVFAYFRFIGVAEAPPRESAAALNPFRFVRRFAVQPRLGLAWLLVTGRECWWNMFVIYTPILAVTLGLGEEAGGAIVSAGIGTLLIATFWGWVGRRYGVRRLLIGGYLMSGAVSMAVFFAVGTPWLAAVLIVAAAMGAGAVEGAGNVPFLRAVRSHERPEMLTVYLTNRGVASIATPAACSLLLQVFALPAVFLAGGLTMLSMAGLARFLPRRLGREARHPLRKPAAGR